MRPRPLGPEPPGEEQDLDHQDRDRAELANLPEFFQDDDLVSRQVHDGFFGRLGAFELPLDVSFAHDQDAIGQREHFRQIARRHQAAGAARRFATDDFVDLELRPDVHPFGRLVEEQHLRLGRQPLGDNDLLLVAAAERVRGESRRRPP